MTGSIRTLLLLGAAAIVACADSTGPGEFDAHGKPEGTFRTSSTGYRFEADEIGARGTIPFSYTNTGSRSIYALGCLGLVPPVLEKLVDGEWVRAWTPGVPRCGPTVIEISPGETFRYTQDVFGAWHDQEKIGPNFEVDPVPGRYRLLWFPQVGPDQDSPLLPLELRISNEFMIELTDD